MNSGCQISCKKITESKRIFVSYLRTHLYQTLKVIQRKFWKFLNKFSAKEFASKQFCLHECAILVHTDLIRSKFNPFWSTIKQKLLNKRNMVWCILVNISRISSSEKHNLPANHCADTSRLELIAVYIGIGTAPSPTFSCCWLSFTLSFFCGTKIHIINIFF